MQPLFFVLLLLVFAIFVVLLLLAFPLFFVLLLLVLPFFFVLRLLAELVDASVNLVGWNLLFTFEASSTEQLCHDGPVETCRGRDGLVGVLAGVRSVAAPRWHELPRQ